MPRRCQPGFYPSQSAETDMTNAPLNGEIALVCGVGPGLGLALVRCLSDAGMKVTMVARNGDRLRSWADELSVGGRTISACACDTSDEQEVIRMYETLEKQTGVPDLVIYNAGTYMPGEVVDISTEDFVKCWQTGCLGGFLVGREAAKRMLGKGKGTILFTGATASLRGSARFANLAVGKFGLRALSQSMARELGPRGVHVAHVIIDGQILSDRYAHLAKERPADGLLDPVAIAENYLHLHRQHRSAWTHELDLRPWVEKF